MLGVGVPTGVRPDHVRLDPTRSRLVVADRIRVLKEFRMDQVQCPKCFAVILLSDRIYGKKFRCKCGIKIQMPQAPVDALPVEPLQTRDTRPRLPHESSGDAVVSANLPPGASNLPAPADPPVSAKPQVQKPLVQSDPRPIQFRCPGCSLLIKVAPELAGYVTRCTCGIKVRAPFPSSAEP